MARAPAFVGVDVLINRLPPRHHRQVVLFGLLALQGVLHLYQ
jgi:hypothetical protein